MPSFWMCNGKVMFASGQPRYCDVDPCSGGVGPCGCAETPPTTLWATFAGVAALEGGCETCEAYNETEYELTYGAGCEWVGEGECGRTLRLQLQSLGGGDYEWVLVIENESEGSEVIYRLEVGGPVNCNGPETLPLSSANPEFDCDFSASSVGIAA